MREPQLFTIGAKAMSGTVWLRMIQGSRPHSTSRQRCITRARAMPTTRPTSQPTAAMPERGQRAERDRRPTAAASPPGGSPARAGAPTMSQTCGIARSVVRGRIRTPGDARRRPPGRGTCRAPRRRRPRGSRSRPSTHARSERAALAGARAGRGRATVAGCSRSAGVDRSRAVMPSPSRARRAPG